MRPKGNFHDLDLRLEPEPSTPSVQSISLALRCLISTLSRWGRVNSKDWIVLRDGLKRGHRRVVLDRQVVPTARGDLAPSLKDGRPLLWRNFSEPDWQ